MKKTKIDYSKMGKKELEKLARGYGLELDRRLKKDTLVRILETTVERFEKEQKLLEIKYYKRVAILAIILTIGWIILRNII